jgi:hypothetical protein
MDDANDLEPLPLPPPSIVFKQQAQSIVTLKQSVAKMLDLEKKKKSPFPPVKNTGIHHWHIARHVFRSGLIFGPTRRSSDSLLPLLMKTHIAQHRSRRTSMDSNPAETPFEAMIDYITYNNTEDMKDKPIIKRTISDSSACLQRNKLDETIAQYEIIMRHLKNYEKFMVAHPHSSSISPEGIQQNEANPPSQKSSIRTRQTQSLARSAGRTFTEFVMNDLLLSQSTETRRLSTVHAASQTDLTELIASIPIEDTNQLDTAVQEAPITPNSEINVIVVSPPVIPEVKKEVR